MREHPRSAFLAHAPPARPSPYPARSGFRRPEVDTADGGSSGERPALGQHLRDEVRPRAAHRPSSWRCARASGRCRGRCGARRRSRAPTRRARSAARSRARAAESARGSGSTSAPRRKLASPARGAERHEQHEPAARERPPCCPPTARPTWVPSARTSSASPWKRPDAERGRSSARARAAGRPPRTRQTGRPDHARRGRSRAAAGRRGSTLDVRGAARPRAPSRSWTA